MDARDELNFVLTNNKQQEEQEKQDRQQIDHHLMVSGLYDEETHTRKSSISFDKIKQISLTYSLQSEDDSQDGSQDVFEAHSGAEDEQAIGSPNNLVNDGRRDSSSSQCCLSANDGDASDTASSRKMSVIDLKAVKGNQGKQNSTFQQQQQQQNCQPQDSNDNNLDAASKINQQTDPNNNLEVNNKISDHPFGGSDMFYKENMSISSSARKASEENFAAQQNAPPSYLQTNPFAFDQTGYNYESGQKIVLDGNNNILGRVLVGCEAGVEVNNALKLNAYNDDEPTQCNPSPFERLSAERGVRNNDGQIYFQPQYYKNISDGVQVEKVNRHMRRHRQHQQHQQLNQFDVGSQALSEPTELRGSPMGAIENESTLIMGPNEIGGLANSVGVNYSPRRKQLPPAYSPIVGASARGGGARATLRQLPGYPQRDHVSRRTMMVSRRSNQYGQLPPTLPAMASAASQPQTMLGRSEHSLSPSLERISPHSSRLSVVGSGSEKSSTNGNPTGLRLKQHNNSISLVLFNKTDANIIISNEPSESCSDESCWGSLVANSSLGIASGAGESSGTGVAALGRQGGTIGNPESNDYLSEEELVNGNEMAMFHERGLLHHHTDNSVASDRDENTTILSGLASGGSYIGEGGVSGGTRLPIDNRQTALSMTSQTSKVLNQRLASMARQQQQQNHRQHQNFQVEKFEPSQEATCANTDHRVSQEIQDLAKDITVNHQNHNDTLNFKGQQQQSPSSLSSTLNETSLNNSYRSNQLPGTNQVRNTGSSIYSEECPQFFGNSSSSQSPLGIETNRVVDRSKEGFGLIGRSVNANIEPGRDLNGNCDQQQKDDSASGGLDNVADHSLVRGDIIINRNMHETQANPRGGFMFDENANEHTGSSQHSPIIIDRGEGSFNMMNRNQFRHINSQQQNMNVNSLKHHRYASHALNQARSNRGTTVLLDNNNSNRRLALSQDQLDQTNSYEFEGEDDEYAYSNSVYASPLHLPQRILASELPEKTFREDGRRVDIVISSPQRYIRPVSLRRPRAAAGQQFWSNSLPRSTLDYLYYNEAQNFQTNAGNVNRRPAEISTNRLAQMEYQHSSPSPVGSQSVWSSYGSRDNIALDGPALVGGTESVYDESTQCRIAQFQLQRQQQQQQKIFKQQQSATNYYQANEITPARSAQLSSAYINDGTGTAVSSESGTTPAEASKLMTQRLAGDISKTVDSSIQQANIAQQEQRLQNADLSGSSRVPEKKSSQVAKDKIETESSNRLNQQSQTKHQQQPPNGNTKTSNNLLASDPQHQLQLQHQHPAVPPKPIKLRNLLNNEQTVDNLHFKYKHNNKSHGCSESRCLASMMNAKPVEYKVRTVNETFEHAKDFINNFYASIKRLDSPAHKTRLAEIEEQLKTNETYYLKETELIYGAKLAWRNAARCIGRIQWSKLQVFDARFTTNANEMFEALCNHIKYATNKGSLRSAITILPQRVKSTNNDWRIWNSQLIGYAGYKNKETGKVIGDPANADFTEICQKLGWKGKGTRFDVLPLVLSANGGPPQMFPLPEDLVLRVKIKHPKYKWFEELGFEWYALPAVANMMLDVGGLQFTAAPFSGWYMVTEIGTRDLGDSNRYNVLEEVAQRMGLNTTSNMSLWKDQAVVELNIAVLDSFQSAGVTIVDHHTATDTFMTHLQNEQRLRGGCPADWVWLVPPTSGSTTQVFHQEMVSYHLLPNYEYQDPVWKNFDWLAWEKMEEKKRDQEANNRKRLDSLAASGETPKLGCFSISPSSKSVLNSNGELTPRKLRFKEIARAVKFTSKLFGKALSRRIKATILYATETGKSERFANKLAQTFSCAFNVHLMSMSDYDMTCLEHEALLLVVTSTFGNGDPPENGELFAKHLAAVKLTGDTSPDIDSINSVSTNPFFQMLSEDHKDSNERSLSIGLSGASSGRAINGSDDSSSSNSGRTMLQVDKQEEQTNIRPLSNVRFGVFALGSTAYPHFCAFGRYVDQTLGELGAERILKCTCGDELCGQEKAFNEWSNQVFKTACDVFCLTDSIGPIEERPEMRWSPQDVRFVPVELIPEPNDLNNNSPHQQGQTAELGDLIQSSKLKSSELLSNKMVIVRNLMNITNKRIIPFTVKNRIDLHPYNQNDFSDLQTLCIDLESDFISSNNVHGVGGTVNASNNLSLSINQTTNQSTNKQTNITFEAGDHIAVYPVNNKEMVEKILSRMREGEHEDIIGDTTTATTKENNKGQINRFDFDQVYTILVKRENMDLTPATPMAPQNALGGGPGNGSAEDNWIHHDRLPVTSIREALMRYLDITSPPNQEFLLILSRQTNNSDERKKLQLMARNFTVYEEWKNKKVPTLLSVLEEFKTIKFEPALVTQIPLIKPRFYSVSGTSTSLTLGVVRFKTISGEYREGLCSNYLNRVPVNPSTYIYGYIRSAPAFHMPVDKSIPMVLISAGTGIAPFRSFWQQRYADMYKQQSQQPQRKQQQGQNTKQQSFGRIEMYFGCRNSNYILYKDELDEMYANGVLSSINIAFSRPRDCDVLEGEDTESKMTTTVTMTSAGTNNNSTSTTTTSSSSISPHHAAELSIKPQPVQRSGSKVASIKQARRKMYVQDRLFEDGDEIYRLIMQDGAHVYVCGDVAMADGVYKTLANIFKQCFKANKLLVSGKCDPSSANANANDSVGLIGGELARSSDDGEGILMSLRNLNRYHEDIFGAKQMS